MFEAEYKRMFRGCKKSITVNAKCGGDIISVKIFENAKVSDLKMALSEKIEEDIKNLLLISGAQVLYDDDTLSKYKIKDHSTVHLVIKPSKSFSLPRYPFEFLGNLENKFSPNILGSLDEEKRSILNSNFVQQMLEKPEAFHKFLISNPKLKQIMYQHPWTVPIINNQEVFRQTVQYARDPTINQQLLRTYDGIMENLKSMPQNLSKTSLRRYASESSLAEAAAAATGSVSNFNSRIKDNKTRTTTATTNEDSVRDYWNTARGISPRSAETREQRINELERKLFMATHEVTPEEVTFERSRNSVDEIFDQVFDAIKKNTPPRSTSQMPAEVRYHHELNSLKEMGFQNHLTNLTALIKHKGDLHAAVQQISAAKIH